jgi:UDPglucose 6-dehydrogenase
VRTDTFLGAEVVNDLDEFTARSDVIVCNRAAPELAAVRNKLYTRDAFGRDI